MAKLLDDLMARVGADWEPTETREAAITISACLPEMHVAMVDSLTMAKLSNTRTDSLKILIEAGYEFLKDKVPMDLDENVDLLLQEWAIQHSGNCNVSFRGHFD